MAWDDIASVLFFGLGSILLSNINKRPQNDPPPELSDIDIPTAEEGRSIPVLFGRRKISSPNVVWWGDLKTTPVRQKVKGLFGSKWQDTGQYKVYLGMHMAICNGTVDYIDRIDAGDLVAWSGVSFGGAIEISNEGLFGGDRKQGGISGKVDFLTGNKDQGKNSYLMSVLGSEIPAFRGVSTAVLNQCYMGSTPSIKPWAFWPTRIFKTSDGEMQWYNGKAAINTGIVSIKKTYKVIIDSKSSIYDLVDYALPTDHIKITKLSDPKAWSPNDYEHDNAWTNAFILRSDQGDQKFWQPGFPAEGEAYQYAQSNPIDIQGVSGDIYVHIEDFGPYDDNRGALGIGIEITRYHLDMNPAHIIRECLTDKAYPLRYSEDMIDDDSFIASADRLYDESMGISLFWTRETPMEEFINEILRHIDGVCYVDKRTGKWKLKLIRSDYAMDDLVYLDEGKIVSISNYKQPTLGQIVNSVTVNFWDSQTGNDGSVTLKDQNLINIQDGVENNETIQYQGFTNYELASRVALRDLKAKSFGVRTFTISCTRAAESLNIGDPFIVNWPDLEINDLVVRVESISYGSMNSNEIVIDCVEDVFSTNMTKGDSTVSVPPNFWSDPTQDDPLPSAPRIAEDAPYRFLEELYGKSDLDQMIASRPDFGAIIVAGGRKGNEINAQLFVSTFGQYSDSGDLSFSPYAEIEDLAMEDSIMLIVGDIVDEQNLILPCFASIGDEYVYAEGMYIDSSQRKIIGIIRGVLDTFPAAHYETSSGRPQVIFWGRNAESDGEIYDYGDVVSVKLATNTGSKMLSVDDAPEDKVNIYSRAKRPYPVANFLISGSYDPSFVSPPLLINFNNRNKYLDAVTPIGWFEPLDIDLEDGFTVTINFYINGVLIHTVSNITSGPISYTPPVGGRMVVEAYVTNGNIDSRVYVREFEVSGDPDAYSFIVASQVPDAYWMLNDSPSFPVTDSSGNGHNGVSVAISTAPPLVIPGNAFRFNGANSYIDLGTDFGAFNEFTLSFVAKFHSVSNEKIICAKWGVLNTDGNTFIAWFNPAQKLNFRIQNTAGTFFSGLVSTTTFNTIDTYHIALMVSDSSKTVSIYVNGIFDSSIPYSGVLRVSQVSESISFGARVKDGAPTSMTSHMWGDMTIDRVAFFTRPLTPQEVSDQYSSI